MSEFSRDPLEHFNDETSELTRLCLETEDALSEVGSSVHTRANPLDLSKACAKLVIAYTELDEFRKSRDKIIRDNSPEITPEDIIGHQDV